MSKAVLVLLVTTLGLGVVSLHLVRQLRAEREQTQSLQAKIGELERIAKPSSVAQFSSPASPFRSAPARVEPAPEAVSATQARVTSSPRAAAALDTAASGIYSRNFPDRDEVMRQMRESQDRQRALLQDPEYRDAMRAQQRMYSQQTYPDLAKELDLSEEEIGRFMDLLAEQQMRSMENAPPMNWGPDTPDPETIQEWQRKAQQQQQANEAEQANLLGPTRLQAWKEYQSTLGVRHQAIQMRTTFAGRGAPLQESQMKPLMKALAQEQERSMHDWQIEQGVSNADPAAVGATSMLVAADGAFTSYAGGFVGQSVEINEEKNLERMRQANKRLRDALSGVLTPQQLKLFEAERNEQLKMHQLQMRLMRAQNRAQPDG